MKYGEGDGGAIVEQAAQRVVSRAQFGSGDVLQQDVFAVRPGFDHNPRKLRFVDQSTGRKGLEPVQPAQGGDIAWSLNLHHPYDPANPIDSLAVAARAINNIISGAALTSSTGSALIEPGLESKAANCQRYTGSAKLVTRPGYPAACASPVSAQQTTQTLLATPSTVAWGYYSAHAKPAGPAPIINTLL